MGSQWAAMAKALMPIDIFAKSINRSHEILKPYGINLLELLLTDDEKVLDTTVAPFVSIAAVQVALTNLLRELGVEPDGIVGHSVGELGCAYGDGCFNEEQMLLSAYWRGKCVEDAKLPKGLMGAIGLTWEEAKRRCPAGVVAACHNSEDSVTISGDYEAAKKFLEELRAENVFARDVKSAGVAFHSPTMKVIAPSLLEKLKKVLTVKPRSSRWVSSSVPESRWNEELAKYSSPDYFVNNLLSPVLFHEAIQSIPKNAICIEIAPHCLLQAILKRSLGSQISYIGFMKRGNNENNLDFLFSAIGKLHAAGLKPAIEKLYPKVEFPVPRGTPSISSLIKWDHSTTWGVPLYPDFFNPSASADFTVNVDLQENDDGYLAGHSIDGRVLYPATGYLFLAWKMLAKKKNVSFDELPVEFENVTLHRATILPKQGVTKFIIRFMETNGEFSISEGETVVVSGRVFESQNQVLQLNNLLDDNSVKSEDALKLSSKDIYKELRLRGYDYNGVFQGLTEASSDGKHGKIKWTNWVTFVDAMLQIGIIGKKTRGLFLPVRFQSVRCDPKVLFEAVEKAGENKELSVVNDPRINATVAKGIEISGLKVNLAPRRQNAQVPLLEKYQFVPYVNEKVLEQQDQVELEQYVSACSSLAKKVLEVSKYNKNQIDNLFTGYKDASDEVLKQYLTASSDEHVLLKVFKELLTTKTTDLKQNVQNVLNKYGPELSKDLLATSYAKQRFVRPSIDIVVENLNSRKLNILEVNPSTVILNNLISSVIESSALNLSYDYTLAHPAPNDLPDEVKNNDLKITEWNLKQSALSSGSSSFDLVVYKDVYSTPTTSNGFSLEALLNSFYSATKENGFVLALLRTRLTPPENFVYTIGDYVTPNKREEEFVKNAEKVGFSVVSSQSDSTTYSFVLLRKTVEKSAKSQTVIEVPVGKYNSWVENLKENLKECQNRKVGENVWLVANDTPANGVVGLVNCLRQEPGGDRVRCIFNASKDHKKYSLPNVMFDKHPYSELLRKDLVMNVYKDGKFGSFRHLQLDEKTTDEVQTEHAYLNVSTRGDLSSLKWYEAQHKYWSSLNPLQRNPSEVLCTVYYAPLNFRDIMLATGKLPPDALPGDMALQDCILGLEFAGRDQSGNRVMGMVASKGLATSLIIDDPQFLWRIPDDWSMEEASTVPVVYGTAYYALLVRGNLQPGESVLIHSGSGGVGQAAIAIALNFGCEVFTTVGSNEKKEYLKKVFPQLTDRNFANSRDSSFEQHVLRETQGRGVDVVLNSLSEEKLQSSVRCLAQHGRFLEIGKYDLSQNNPLGN